MRASVARAAEGFDRRAITVDEVLRMQEAGIISDDENFDPIEDEIVAMPAQAHCRELLKSALTLGVAKALPHYRRFGVGTTIYLTANTFVEPDPTVYPRELKRETAKGSDISLAVEVSLTSLARELGVKSRPYARHGFQEFCATDAARRRAFVPTGPREVGWSRVVELGPEATLACPALPGFALRLDEV